MSWKNVQYQNGKFKTTNGGGGGSSTFAGLDDVSFNNLQGGQVPKYNSTTQKWENADESGGGGTVTDVTVNGTSVVNQQGVAEIPAIPDGLHHYSTTEHVVGTWIDGKPLYEKTVDFGALPNATNKSIAHNISNIDKIAHVYGVSWNNSNSYIPLPFINTTNASSSCQLEVNATNVYIRTGVNLSSYANTYITLQYTKTTD